jgi:hypothetical protein
MKEARSKQAERAQSIDRIRAGIKQMIGEQIQQGPK